jgi:hypothetical protein
MRKPEKSKSQDHVDFVYQLTRGPVVGYTAEQQRQIKAIVMEWVETVTALVEDNCRLRTQYTALARKWNRLVREYNAIAPRPVGRPIGTSPEQQSEILRLHKGGASIRAIAKRTGLGRDAVSTVVDRAQARAKGPSPRSTSPRFSPIAVERELAGAQKLPEAVASALRAAAPKP